MSGQVIARNFKGKLKLTAAMAALAGVLLAPHAAQATLIAAGSTSPSAGVLNGTVASGLVSIGSGTENVSSQVHVGLLGAGSLSVNSSSTGNGVTTLNANSGGSTSVVVGSGGTGTMTLDGTGGAVTLNSANSIQVGAQFSATAGNGTLNVQNGATAQTTTDGSGVTIGNSLSTGAVTVSGAGSTLSSAGTLNVGAFSSSIGSLTVSGGGVVQTTSANPFNNSMFIGDVGGAGTVTVTGTGSSLSARTIDIGTAFSAASSLTVSNNAEVTADIVFIGENGTLKGDGTINGDVTLGGGTLAPGNSPGTMEIFGDLSLLDGVLEIEIDPLAVSDFFIVHGNLIIGPNLLIDLQFASPPPGGSVDILSFFDVFATIDIDPAFDLNSPSNIKISGNPGTAPITVVANIPTSVPEPASLVLLLTGIAGAGIMRRRRKAGVGILAK